MTEEQSKPESKERERAKNIRQEIEAVNRTIGNLNGRIEIMEEQEDHMISKVITDEGLLNESSWEMSVNLCSITSILPKESFKGVMDLVTLPPREEEDSRVPDHVILERNVIEANEEYPEETSVVLYLHPKLVICAPASEFLLDFISKHQLAVDTEMLTKQRDEMARSLLMLEDIIEVGGQQKDRIEADRKKLEEMGAMDVPASTPAILSAPDMFRRMFGPDIAKANPETAKMAVAKLVADRENVKEDTSEETAKPIPVVEEQENKTYTYREGPNGMGWYNNKDQQMPPKN